MFYNMDYYYSYKQVDCCINFYTNHIFLNLCGFCAIFIQETFKKYIVNNYLSCLIKNSMYFLNYKNYINLFYF